MPGFILEYILDNILEISRTRDGTKDVVNEKRRFFMKALRAAPAAMGRGTARPGNTTAEPPKTPEKRGNAGSTIMAVLIALVFIGIVTAAMVRNTGSQSSASVGYGTMQTMAVTTSSGIIATESYMEKSGDPEVLNKITEALNPSKGSSNDPQPFLFNNNGEKVKIAGDQFFSSKLIIPNKNVPKAYFKIGSGRNKNKRDLKTALAFYDMSENLKITNSVKYKAHNAVYFYGDVSDANNAMEVIGPATFEGKIKFQNANTVFHEDAYFNKGVEFLAGAPKFKDKAYFNDYLNIQNVVGNTALVFDSAVGINGNFSTGGDDKTIKAGGDVWFNGVFKDPYGTTDVNAKLAGDNATTKFYYTDKLSMATSAMGCNKCPGSSLATCTVKNGCCPHDCDHDFDQSVRIKDFVNMKPDSTSGYLPHKNNIDNIQQRMGMGTLDDRRDPQLDITQIPADKFTTLTINGGMNLNLTDLNAMYDKGPLYDGHLVVKVSGGGLNFNSGSEKFDKKVIFVLENNATLNNKYFPTTENSSTLIYVGAGNATINNNFGLNGAFHGLIYIDSLNTATNYLSFGAGDTLVGAIHSFSNQKLSWNTKDPSAPPVIKFDENVLNNYSSLAKSSTESTKTAEYADSTKEPRVYLKGVGYYFY